MVEPASIKDSRLHLEGAPADGTFTVAVRDLHDRGVDRSMCITFAPSGPCPTSKSQANTTTRCSPLAST